METLSIEAEEGETLLALLRKSGHPVPAPCGGAGTCGKCKIRIVAGDAGPLAETEKRLLSEREREKGVRLACKVVPRGRLEVEEFSSALNRLGKGAWENGFPEFAREDDSWLQKRAVRLSQPSLEDQRSELLRLIDFANPQNTKWSPHLLERFSAALRDGNRELTLVEQYARSSSQIAELLDVEEGDTSSRSFGCAVDIGTTTVAVYMADLTSRIPFDSIARSNAQASYGADVISRIGYAMEHEIAELRDAIRNQLNRMISVLCRRNGISTNEVYRLVIVGNTTMLHLLLGVDPSGIAAAPFIPVFTEDMVVDASALELGMSPAAQAHIVPGVSAYVGADITAGLVSADVFESEGACLFIDVGTNGEIVLKHDGQLWACSAAAGPAFEGAKIRWGTGGEDGAVDFFSVGKDGFAYTTIGGKPAVGICGAGLVDVLAELLIHGLIDEKGRLMSVEGLDRAEMDDEQKELFRPRLTEIEGKPAFIIVPANESGVGEDIALLNRDVREVQLAKGAVAGGIYTLLEKAELDISDIAHLYLAGGFGSYVRRESAGEIGLIPKEIVSHTMVVGNAAGKGALFALLSREMSSRFRRIVERTSYIELSSEPVFQKFFMNEMYF